jgi:nucleoid-associated protein YgaU
MPDEATPETPAKPPAAATPSAPASPTPAAPATPVAPASPAAAAATAVAEPVAPEVPKVKPKKATQRACDEKDAKGKLCCGHLKRWYDYPKEIEALVGAKAEVYRCEFCRTLYTPDRSQAPHSYTLRY